jgi:hypothetical protein
MVAAMKYLIETINKMWKWSIINVFAIQTIKKDIF